MMVKSIDTIHTQGVAAVDRRHDRRGPAGQRLLRARQDDRQRYYTRAGAFSLDRDGRLVNPANGMRVQGWMATRRWPESRS